MSTIKETDEKTWPLMAHYTVVRNDEPDLHSAVWLYHKYVQ